MRLRRFVLCLAVLLSLSPVGALAQPAMITTLAGGGPANGSAALSAGMYWPGRVAMVPGTSDFLVAVIEAHRVFRVSASTGQITTVVGAGGPGFNGDNILAASAQISYPYGIAVDPGTGDLLIADSGNNRIRRVTAATGLITTVAGTGAAAYNGDNMPATTARLNTPWGVAFDPTNGDVLIADTGNHRVRRVSAATGIITTVAGTSALGYNGDNIAATAAQLYSPEGVTVAPGSGDVFIADTGNSRVRRVAAASGLITTVAGGYGGVDSDGIPAISAQIYAPADVVVHPFGHLLIAESGGNRVRIVAADTGVIWTIAGIGGTGGFSGDGGPAASAMLNWPFGLALDGVTGDLIVADLGNNVVRRVSAATSAISTVAGNGTASYSGENVPAAQVQLNNPGGAAVDPITGDVLIADPFSHRIWRLTAATGLMTTFGGTGVAGFNGDGFPAAATELNSPGLVAFDPTTGDVILLDGGNGRIRRVAAATGLVSTIAGGGTGAGENIPAMTARIYGGAFAVDPTTGDIYLAESSTANRVRRVAKATGLIATVAGVWAPSFNGDNIPATSAYLNSPSGVAIDPNSGDLYIADSNNYRIRRVAASSGIITTVAGTGSGAYNGEDIPATSAQIGVVAGVAFDPATGDLLITDVFNGRVRRVSATTGLIATIAGTGAQGFNGDNIPATTAQLSLPIAVTVHPITGAVIISDSGNDRIRSVAPIYTLALTLSGPGAGTVVSAPNGVACPGDCTEGYASGTVVTLSASPAGGSTFAGWSGDPDCADGSVTMLGERHCTAIFNVVGLAGQTITFDLIGDRPFSAQPFAVTATASSGLPVSFSAFGHCSVAGTAVTMTGIGSCTIMAFQPGDATYNAAPPVAQTFAIQQAPQTISFDPIADRTYGDPPFTVSATASSGLPVSFGVTGSCMINGGTVTALTTGICTITASQSGNASYAAASPVAQSVNILKASQTISFAALSDRTFDPALQIWLSATASSGLPVSFGVTGDCTSFGSYLLMTGGGSCTVTASQAGNQSYAAAPPVARTFAINPATQTISFGALPDTTYGDPDVNLTATATSGLAASYSASGPCAIHGSSAAITGAGSCTITASQAGNQSYSAATPVARTFAIAKLGQTITLGTLPAKGLGDPPFSPGATASSGLPVSYATSGGCTVNQGIVTLTAAGTCTVTASQAGNANYNPAPDVARAFNVVIPTYTLAVSLAGNGSGTVTSSPGGINCPTACSAAFQSGTVVTLTAAPGPGSVFIIWGGACMAACTLTMDAAKAVTATFAPNKADLLETSLTNPPPALAPGANFSVTDTTLNQGGVASVTSTTRYYLSLDTVKDAADRLLTGTRAVPVLGWATSSTGTIQVTVPTSTPLGTYYLLACADDTARVAESNEANNCLASSATIQVTRPDLVESQVSAPPATATQGSSFSVTDTVLNQGGLSAGTSTTRYYLSANPVKDGNDRLIGSRSVPTLGVSGTSTGTATVTVPSSMALGTYYLIACADNTTTVTESDETNNCLTSTATVQVLAP